MDDLDLLALEASTIFVLSHSGRTLRRSSPARAAGPRMYLAGCASGNVFRLRADVGEATAEAIAALIADEPPFDGAHGAPLHVDDYHRLLAVDAAAPAGVPELIWTFPDRLAYQHPAPLGASDTPEGDRLLARLREGGMPDALVTAGFVDVGEFWAPWCVALEGDQIASIAFTVGYGPASAEVGVYAFPAFRGRGLAAAATAGWAALPALSGRTLFYSTSTTNASSRRVVERLGLRFIGASFSIS